MKVLVTGSTGRIGRAAVEALLVAGHSVRGLDLRPSGREAQGYEEMTASVDSAEAAARATEEIDAVFHLGAFMSWNPAERGAMFAANVEGTRILLDAASAAGARRFVFASSGEVYPENAPQYLPIDEGHPLCPNSPYGLTKLLGEELVRFHQRAGKMETVILRFSHTQNADELLDEESFFSGPRFFLGPRIRQQENFGNHAIADLLRRHDPGSPVHILARNEAGRPFKMHITDTRDMVAGLMLALDHPLAAGEVFNLGGTAPVDFEQLLQDMSVATGYPVVTVDLPGAGVYYHTSNEKIRRELEFNPVWTVDRMLEQAVASRKRRQTE